MVLGTDGKASRGFSSSEAESDESNKLSMDLEGLDTVGLA